jgi:ABC-type Fe3+/spermidine/putrescine transport system ATPase subunit
VRGPLIRPLIRFEAVAKRFGRHAAVDGVSLDIGAGEFFVLLGPSGCGKTTLMRMLAGFETPDTGRVLLDGVDLAGSPPHRRPVNMMFQSYALFPHLTVAGNVAYGLRQAGMARGEAAERVAGMLALVQLGHLADRKPDQLSGGERQRTALARALARRPQVLLLDEPLGALDRRLREETRSELKRVQASLGTTFLMVTHDQDEAMALADRMAVMRAGKVVQVGPPAEVYRRPADRDVAGFLGEVNLFPRPEGGWRAVRPERLRLTLARPEGVEAFAGVVESAAYLGDRTHYGVRLEGVERVSALQLNDGTAPSFQPGEPVWASFSEADAAALTA